MYVYIVVRSVYIYVGARQDMVDQVVLVRSEVGEGVNIGRNGVMRICHASSNDVYIYVHLHP